MPKLSIVILQHNSPTETENCLRSIKNAWLPEETEIVVVDNGGQKANSKISPDSFNSLNIKFLDIPNKGYPQGNNEGLKHTNGEYIAFVNPDILVQENTFKILLDYFEKNPAVGIVAPQLIYPDGTIQDNYRVFPRFIDLIIKRTGILRKIFPQRMRRYLMWDKETSLNEAVDWVTGAFEIISRKCLENIKKHNEKFFLFMSDVALCREAWKKNYQVHYVAMAKAHHNDERLSSGGFSSFFKKRILRIHVMDAIKYYLHYFNQRLPDNSPSLSHIQKKDRLLKARILAGTSAVKKLTGKLQRSNPVVTVFKAKIVGHQSYEQPVVFFDTGVVAVIKNMHKQFGLIQVWRHIPLSFNKKNTFPVFPEVADLGMWSYECPRGGIEKSDKSAIEALKREIKEEAGIEEKHILEIQPLGNIIGNTAIDVYHHKCFEVTVSDEFKFSTDEKIETIKDFIFVDKSKLSELINKHQLFCGISQAALLQAIAYQE